MKWNNYEEVTEVKNCDAIVANDFAMLISCLADDFVVALIHGFFILLGAISLMLAIATLYGLITILVKLALKPKLIDYDI